MSEEVKVFQETVPEENNTLEEIEIPEDCEFGYVVSMTKEGNVYFSTFGGPNNLKKTWLLAGLNHAASVIINSNVEKQINVSNTHVLGEMLSSTKQLVQVMKTALSKPTTDKE